MKTVMKEFISNLKGVLGAYLYEVPGKVLPVLVLQDGHLPERPRIPKEIQGGILLTKDDITYGQDVFGVTFLHIQQRSMHLHGEDFFTDMILPHETMRMHLEGTLRQLLIDIREYALVRFMSEKQLLNSLPVMLDRVRLATVTLMGETPYSLEMLKAGVSMIDRSLGIQQSAIYEMIFEKKTIDLDRMYDHLYALVRVVDTLGTSVTDTKESVRE